MCAGFPGAAAICMLFVTKVTGLTALPALVTSLMFLAAAEANTSPGAPSLIWVASAELPPKLNTIFVPACAFSNRAPRAVNGSVKDAAAKTVIDPDRPAVPPRSPPDGVPDDEQPPIATVSAARRAATRLMPVLRAPRRRRWWT